MIDILDESRGSLLALRIKGEITKQDFEVLNPMLEKTIAEHQAPRIYMELGDPEKVTPGAAIEDLSNMPKYNQLKKIAVVGDAKWKEMMTGLLGKLVSPTAKYFNFDEKAEAMEWIKED